MNIIININRSYVKQASTLLYSILKNNNSQISLYVMNTDLSNDDFASLDRVALQFEKERCSITNLKMDDSVLQNCYVKNGRWPMTVYYRLFAPFLLPALDRVLYLDSDMVVDGSLEPLYNLYMGNNMIAGVPDDVVCQKGEFHKRLNLSDNHVYVNSGMILFNIRRILEKLTIEDINRIIQKNQNNLFYPDQDILNIMYTNYISVVDYGYNWICIPGRNNETNKVVIYHFGGEKEYKPWNAMYIGKHSDIFWKYARNIYNKENKKSYVFKTYGYVYHYIKVLRRSAKRHVLRTFHNIRY